MLDCHELAAEEAIGRAGGRLIETIGDGLLATFAGSSQAVAAARAVQDAALGLGVSVRAGVHAGEIERRGERIGGIGVHIAARVMSLANAGEVLASRTVRDLAVGSKLEFEYRGTHTLKGVTDPWQLFSVTASWSVGPARTSSRCRAPYGVQRSSGSCSAIRAKSASVVSSRSS